MTPLSAKHAAARLNLTPSGLKYLELRGQLHPIRDSGGRRSYDPREIEKLAERRGVTTVEGK